MANIPDSAVGFLLENLKQFVEYNSNLIGGVNKNVTKLYLDLDNLKAFIKKYAERQSNSEILEKLANEIRVVVHEAEDAIEAYILCESSQKMRNAFARGVHIFDYVSDLRKAGKQIEEVSAKVTDFYQNKAHLGFDVFKIEETSGGFQKKHKKVRTGLVILPYPF